MKQRHGFTLVEIVVVVSVIALLAGVGIASYANTRRAARDKDRQADIEVIAAAMETYYEQNGTYPSNAQVKEPLSSEADYTAAAFGAPFLKQKLHLETAAFVAPDVDDSVTTSVDIASSAGQNPTNKNRYLYYATSDAGSACTVPPDWSIAPPSYELCEKFTLKYKKEQGGDIVTITSKYGN